MAGPFHLVAQLLEVQMGNTILGYQVLVHMGKMPMEFMALQLAAQLLTMQVTLMVMYTFLVPMARQIYN